jgi:ferredoxin-type protein NapH
MMTPVLLDLPFLTFYNLHRNGHIMHQRAMKLRQKIRKGVILSSFFLFPATFYYLSPYLIIDATMKGIINGSFVMFSLMFLSSLVLGRGFCGWVCPGAGCQEALFAVRDKKVRAGDSIKWMIWIPWIVAIVVLAIRGGGYKKIDLFYQTTHGISIGNIQAVISYVCVLLLIAVPALIAGKRSFCHHLCWMAPFMISGRKIRNIFQWPSLQLTADREKCQRCHTCSDNCPMSLPVEAMVHEDMMENAECILCGTCVDGCRNGAITYAFYRSRTE